MTSGSRLNVIPYPAVVEFVGPDVYLLPKVPGIRCHEALLPQAQYLQHALQQRFSISSNVQQFAPNTHEGHADPIKLQMQQTLPALDQFRWSQEGYELSCSAEGVVITATTTTGIFYGIQTLLQALQLNAEQQSLCLPHTKVLDAPRFIWRGVLLDVGRHFFPVPFILKLLDLLALYKMNRFHWHLTEDQGWRLEVPSLPRLAEIAAWRGKQPAAAGTAQDSAAADPQQQQQQQQQEEQQQAGGGGAGDGAGGSNDGVASVLGRPPPSAATFHGGYYSQADVAKIVAYAAERCIEVVPEIELPGHCVAALAAYPNLSCTGDVAAVSTHWGIHEDVYCAGNEEVFTFLETVLDQVMAQFPCSFIHIGGDEVPKVRWEDCAKCQARMEQEGLTSEAELQSWFVRRISKYLAQHNRRLIGWDEILEGGLAEGATVMSWRGNIGGIIAAKSGHDVIMTPTSHCYFDYRQAPSACEPGAWYACLPLHVVYQYDPVPRPWQDMMAAATAAAAGAPMNVSTLSEVPEDPEDTVMGSPAGSSADGGSPSSKQMEDVSGGGADSAAAAAAGGPAGSCDQDLEASRPSHQQQQPPQTAADAVAAGASPAVVPPAAAAAAGPHYPGHPPGASLAPLAAAATAAAGAETEVEAAADGAAGAGSSGSGSNSRQGVLSEAEAAHILGSQANLWTEYVADEATAEYMLMPRLAALAEAVWTPVEVKDWSSFMSRLQDQLPLLDQLGYLYRPLGP